MATNPNDKKARKSIGKFARTLLATTCLTVATGATASASLITYNEGTSPAPGNFSDTFAGASSLTAAPNPGTTVVNGAVFIGEDTFDYFELTGLGSGVFTLSASEGEGGPSTVNIFDTSGNSLGTSSYNTGSPANFAPQLIPLNGDVVVELTSSSSSFYTVTVNTTAPEPGTLATAALGLAGAVALTKKRRKQKA